MSHQSDYRRRNGSWSDKDGMRGTGCGVGLELWPQLWKTCQKFWSQEKLVGEASPLCRAHGVMPMNSQNGFRYSNRNGQRGFNGGKPGQGVRGSQVRIPGLSQI